MPDRAVVDFVAEWIENQDLSCVDTSEELAYNWRGDMQRLPAPRALVAISADWQWLVVLEGEVWVLFRRGFGSNRNYYESDTEPDTGQSADDVLREWMGA